MTQDDPTQYELARAAADEGFHISGTVLLETDWVLRSYYGWTRAQRVAGFRILLDLPGAMNVPPYARWAVERLNDGADLADMIHVGSAAGASSFATFDKKLRKRAGPTAPVPIETLA